MTATTAEGRRRKIRRGGVGWETNTLSQPVLLPPFPLAAVTGGKKMREQWLPVCKKTDGMAGRREEDIPHLPPLPMAS